MPLLAAGVAARFLLACVVTPLAAQQSSSTATSAPTMPDSKLTMGDTLPITLANIQVRGYSSKVRNVPLSVKREVYAAYGIAHWNKGEYGWTICIMH